jgi:hypothetical protein
MAVLRPLLRVVLIALPLLTTGAFAHEGHDHGDEPIRTPAAGAPARLAAAAGAFELVAVVAKGELLLYLDRFETNAPIVDASISVETPDGPATAQPDGSLYRLAAPWAKPGSHELSFVVTADGQSEILGGTLTIAAGTSETDVGTSGSLHWLMLGAGSPRTWLVLGLGFLAGLLVAGLMRRPAGKRPVLFFFVQAMVLVLATGVATAHEGHDHAGEQRTPPPAGEFAGRLPDGALFVPKSIQRILAIRTVLTQASSHHKSIELPGRIIPDPNASGFVQASVSGRLSPPQGGFPRLGAVVKAGDVLAFVTPPFQAIDVSDMRQKAGELEQQISIVERRIARYEALAKTGAVTQVALDEAVLELKGLRERRAALDRTRGESERLIAPVSGVVASVNAVAGQIAESNAVVFQIIDPARLWVEALTFSHVSDVGSATARTTGGRILTLSFRGAGLTDRSQAIPVHFAIEGEVRALRVGELVTVVASTGELVEGLAVPRVSVVRGANGQTVLFEHTAPERFEPRLVRVEPLDAERVLVLNGLSPGRRVVVQGAELLNQIR